MKYVYLDEKTYQANGQMRYVLIITTQYSSRDYGETTISSLEFSCAEDREDARRALKKAYDVY